MSPDDCDKCRRIFAALDAHQKQEPNQSLTARQIGAAVELKERATRVHLTHLYEHGRIDATRRAPLAGAAVGQPMLPGAQEWAASVVAPDPTCHKCLIALSGKGFDGVYDTEWLAAEAGESVRSIERHRPHIVAWKLAKFTPVSIPAETAGRFQGRGRSRFTLMSGLYARRLTEAEKATVPARAAALVGKIDWYVKAGVDHEDRVGIEIAMRWMLYAGWPEEALLQALDASKERQVRRPHAYMAKLLAKLREEDPVTGQVRPRRYLVPVRDLYTPQLERRGVACSVCGSVTWTDSPTGGEHVLCGGAVCLDAGIAPQRASSDASVTPLIRTA
ncbi:hypothetical protein G5C51_04510 [Streptomyces sp. A7024]|uniref:Uncharacterized protein n=1 Tax=Streptomyces coryli TaxID=1128680 RepID=A0A6G4TUE6_9ACTN|nr:hypothetical protein [Streptomyces coryli]NGN63170.1 hypothetical protein [Streptomyces coryli]